MKAVIPLWPFERSTLAKTRMLSAVSPRLIQIFAAVQDVAIAVATRGRRQVGRIRSDSRLGQPERCELLAARLRHQVALLLLLVPPLEQRQRIQTGVDREDDPECGVGALHLLAQQGEGDVVHAGPAVLLGDRQAEESLSAHLLVEAAVVLGVGVQLLDAGQDLALGEGARGALHLALRIGQRKVDHRFSVGMGGTRQILDR